MVSPDDDIPVDIMLEHHMRMMTGNMSTVEAAVIDNHPPWDERKGTQEPLLSRYRRSQGATGNVQVKSVNYTKMSALLQRFFGQSPLQLYKSHPSALNLFRREPNAVVLQPPDLCTSTRTSEKGVCKVGNA